MKKQGPIILIVGLILVGISLSIAMSVVPSDISNEGMFSISSMFEGMFDEISHEIRVLSGDSVFVSYSTISSEVPLLWGIQINDYQPEDRLSIHISNIFGDEYGDVIQDEPILFEIVDVQQSDTLNFEIENLGTRDVYLIVMFSEDPENSDAFSNPDSHVMNMLFTLTVSGILLVLGSVVSIIGVITTILSWKNAHIGKRNY